MLRASEFILPSTLPRDMPRREEHLPPRRQIANILGVEGGASKLTFPVSLNTKRKPRSPSEAPEQRASELANAAAGERRKRGRFENSLVEVDH